MSEDRGRLPGDLLRRAAEAILSQRTVENIVIPALADLQHESLRAQDAPPLHRVFVLARGYLAFWSALTLYLCTWPARSLREDWLASDAAGRRVLSAFVPRAGLLGLVLTSILLGQGPTHWARQARDPLIVLASLPYIIVSPALPIAFLLGLVLAVRRVDAGPGRLVPRRCLGPIVGLSVATALFSFVLFAWLTPEANQSLRERLYRGAVPKGSRELTIGELRTSIREGRLRGERSAALEVEWHKKWSLPGMCLVLGPLAVGLVQSARRRSAALPITYSVSVLFAWFVLLRIGEQAALAGRAAPVVAMWVGNVLFGFMAVLLLTRSDGPRKDGAQAAL